MLIELAEIIGIVSFAISGFYISVKNDLDILGIFIISFLTALGGGIIRDLILNIPPISLKTTLPTILVIVTVLILIFLKFHKKDYFETKPIFIIIDSIGLASFSISGALLAIAHNFSIFGVIILAFITAVGGGILRDMLLNIVPYILRGGFYGVIAVCIGFIIYLASLVNLINIYFLTIVLIISIYIRWIAFKNSWKLIKIN